MTYNSSIYSVYYKSCCCLGLSVDLEDSPRRLSYLCETTNSNVRSPSCNRAKTRMKWKILNSTHFNDYRNKGNRFNDNAGKQPDFFCHTETKNWSRPALTCFIVIFVSYIWPKRGRRDGVTYSIPTLLPNNIIWEIYSNKVKLVKGCYILRFA